MTSRSYFDKLDSTPGSVVPLATFLKDGFPWSKVMFDYFLKLTQRKTGHIYSSPSQSTANISLNIFQSYHGNAARQSSDNSGDKNILSILTLF